MKFLPLFSIKLFKIINGLDQSHPHGYWLWALVSHWIQPFALILNEGTIKWVGVKGDESYKGVELYKVQERTKRK